MSEGAGGGRQEWRRVLEVEEAGQQEETFCLEEVPFGLCEGAVRLQPVLD